jgi:hypothetical protein
MKWLYPPVIILIAILNPLSSFVASNFCKSLYYYELQLRPILTRDSVYIEFEKLNEYYIGAYIFVGVLTLFPQMLFMNAVIKTFCPDSAISLLKSHQAFFYSQFAYLPLIVLLPWDFGWHRVMAGRNIDVDTLLVHLALILITSIISWIMFFKKTKSNLDSGSTLIAFSWAKAIVFCCVIFFAGAFMYRQTPYYTVDQIREAISERDYSSFCQYVDVDNILNQTKSLSENNPNGSPVNQFARNFVSFVQGEGQKPFIDGYINGHFYFNMREIMRDARVIPDNGNHAMLNFIIWTSYEERKSFVIFDMEKVNGKYRVVGIKDSSKILENPLPKLEER